MDSPRSFTLIYAYRTGNRQLLVEGSTVKGKLAWGLNNPIPNQVVPIRFQEVQYYTCTFKS